MDLLIVCTAGRFSELDANCYDNPGANGTLDVQCGRQLSCIPFQNYLNSNGGCPPCPNGQYIANQTLCICYGGKLISSAYQFNILYHCIVLGNGIIVFPTCVTKNRLFFVVVVFFN